MKNFENIESHNYYITERPGYFGKRKDEFIQNWNKKNGNGNWEIKYIDNFEKEITFENEIFEEYILGYEKFFKLNLKI